MNNAHCRACGQQIHSPAPACVNCGAFQRVDSAAAAIGSPASKARSRVLPKSCVSPAVRCILQVIVTLPFALHASIASAGIFDGKLGLPQVTGSAHPAGPVAVVPNAAGSADTGGYGSWLGGVPPMFVTKDQLLAATLHGDLSGISSGAINDHQPEAKALIASIAVILANEYKTPIPDDSRQGGGCSTARTFILSALKHATERHVDTLSTNLPDFTSKITARGGPQKDIDSFRYWCVTSKLGVPRPYAVADSFAALISEFDDATKQFVEAKRTKLIATYQAEQKEKREAAARAEADRREAEQTKIEAERKRIEDEQRRKQQRDAARVSG